MSFLRKCIATGPATILLTLAALVCVNDSNASENDGSLSGGKPDTSSACKSFRNTRPICLFSNPEDMAVLPGNKVLIVSEYGDIDGVLPGRLAFYAIETQSRTPANFGSNATTVSELWGDDSCEEPPDARFSPHGIDLSRLPDGRLQLLVVQHGGRESVEFFEVSQSSAGWELIWRGCAVAPPNARLNAVASDGHGGFVTTRMRSATGGQQLGDEESSSTAGVVYRWRRATGFSALRGTTGLAPNGIAVAPDGKSVFVVYSGESELRKFDVETGALLASAVVRFGDNIKWSADGGALLVASFVDRDARGALARCASSKAAACRIEFAIIEVDPETLSQKTLFENPNAPMTAGTVGLRVGETLFIGSFVGDRILQVALNGL